MPTFDLPSAIAASTARSRGVSACSGSSGAATPEHPADHLGVERAAAGRDAGDGVEERADVADAFLEQVADALGALADELEREGGLAELREDEHAGARAGADAARWRRRRPSSSRRGGIRTSTIATSGR